MMPRKAVFRRRYIVKRGLQSRYIVIVLFLALLASLVSGFTVFITGWTLLGEKLANVYPQGRLLYVFKATNLALARNLLFVSPLIFILALLFSHRIAGPLYRIERTIDEIARGNLTIKIQLRKRDELSDLAEIINKLTENFNKYVAHDKETVVKMQATLDDIKKAISSQPYDLQRVEASLKTLQIQLSQLNSSLNQWNTIPS